MSRKKRKSKIAVDARIERRMVPNPLRTDATYRQELEEKPITDQPGMIQVDVNMATLIGGFARVKKRTEAQTMAAARFRGLWERSQLGGSRAFDYAAVKVDTSGQSESSIFEMGEQARREYMGVVRRLGMVKSSLVEQVIVHDMSIRDLVKAHSLGTGGAARDKMTKSVQEAVDDMAEHFGLMGNAPEKAKARAWDDDSDTHYSGEVANYRRDRNAA